MKTRTDLVHRALFNLGVLPQGQNPGNEEFNLVDALVDPVIEDLIARDVCFIESVDAIEEKFFLHLGDVLAGRAAATFGMQNDQALAARMIAGEQALNEIDMKSWKHRHMRIAHPDYPVCPRVDISTLFTT
jgi:hypothetical protein